MNNNSVATSLSLGLLTTTNPCILLLYTGFLAYLNGQGEMGRNKIFPGVEGNKAIDTFILEKK